MVGAGVTRNPLHCHRFWQQLKGQPVEFTRSPMTASARVAVLRTGPTESLIQGLHQSVFRAEKRIGPVLFGKGNIGSRWLELFAREQSTLSARTGFEFVLAGVVDSRRSLLSYDGLDASRALAFFNDEAVEQDEESLFLWMRAHPYDDLVVLDVTASQQLADQYLDFASHGFHVISANKLAGASDSNKYRQIHDAFENRASLAVQCHRRCGLADQPHRARSDRQRRYYFVDQRDLLRHALTAVPAIRR